MADTSASWYKVTWHRANRLANSLACHPRIVTIEIVTQQRRARNAFGNADIPFVWAPYISVVYDPVRWLERLANSGNETAHIAPSYLT